MGLSPRSSRWAYSHFALNKPIVPYQASLRGEPPHVVAFDLEEALNLLAALEDSWDTISNTDHFAVLSQVEHQIEILSRKLGLDEGGFDVQ